MTFSGLDPAEVTASADILARQAAALDHVAVSVDALLRTVTHHWEGADAQDFHQWWVAQHRPGLVAAAQTVRTMSTDLRNQVADQQHASGSSGHVSIGRAVSGVPDSVSGSSHDRQWVLEMAQLAKAAYGKGGAPDGFTPVETVMQGDGFEAHAYRYAKPDGSTGYVIAFGGSDDLHDWVFNNATDKLGIGASQYKQAVDMAREYVAKYPGADLAFTGHSLGGGLASVASIATGQPATTFNAAEPGYSDLYYAMHQTYPSRFTYIAQTAGFDRIHPDVSGITTFRTADDVLTGSESAFEARQSALGTGHTLSYTHPQLSPISAHGIDNVIASIADDGSEWWR